MSKHGMARDRVTAGWEGEKEGEWETRDLMMQKAGANRGKPGTYGRKVGK